MVLHHRHNIASLPANCPYRQSTGRTAPLLQQCWQAVASTGHLYSCTNNPCRQSTGRPPRHAFQQCLYRPSGLRHRPLCRTAHLPANVLLHLSNPRQYRQPTGRVTRTAGLPAMSSCTTHISTAPLLPYPPVYRPILVSSQRQCLPSGARLRRTGDGEWNFHKSRPRCGLTLSSS